ncbi:CheR family methyltransferase [Desulfitobacterium sp. Sab5]|uniref:CheR family methyltransferase n=1 Tax=Desulfitobacterium TaxID=36853 RepID=UPI003CF17D38
MQLLFEGIYRYYGFDFRNYTLPYLQRRVRHRLQTEQLPNISRLLEKALYDSNLMERFFKDLTINVTEMFRDPSFFLSLRLNVLPELKKMDRVRIWQAGCSTGEESFSLAILLEEEGILQKTKIYATDLSETSLNIAQKGSFPIAPMQQYTRNYLHAGGKQAFSQYYKVSGDRVQFLPSLADHIIFAQHDLVTDQSFNEFDLILCRNVLIYFNKLLQKKVHSLFYESLRPSGFLALGSKEGLSFSARAHYYEPVDIKNKIYQKIL